MTYPSIRPTLSCDFSNSRTLDPKISFSRNSSATYLNPATGLITTAPANVARFEKEGLLIEESRTNFLTYSNDFSQWNTAAGSAVGSQLLAPDGTNTGSIVTSTGGGVNNTSVSGSGAKVLSAYFKNVASGVTVRFGSTSDLNRVFFDSSYQITGQDSNVLSATFEDSSNGWKKLTIVSSADFNAVLVYSTPGSFGVWGAQLEAGNFPTSYIPTSASTVTRAGDVALIDGVSFSSFFRSGASSWYVKGKGGKGAPTNTGRFISPFGAGASSASTVISCKAGDSDGWNAYDGPNNPSVTGAQEHYSSVGSCAVAYDTTTLSIVSAPKIESNATSLHGTRDYTGVVIGSKGDFSESFLNGNISRLSYYDRRLTDAQLMTLTS